MKKNSVFIDTSGFYAALVTGDKAHGKARDLLARFAETGTTAVTTDYIIDETATLLRVRGAGRGVEALLGMIKESRALALCFVDEEVFMKAAELFVKRSDQSYSFTDCTSFLLMRKLKLSEALTTDGHFETEGFRALLK